MTSTRPQRSITYQDWTLQPGASVEQPIDASHNALVHVFQGTADVGGRAVGDGQLALLGRGEGVRLAVPATAEQPVRFLLLTGRPIGEAVARHGPFVMNTEAELRQAFVDYRAGRLGEIAR